jgi:hypothetical protein
LFARSLPDWIGEAVLRRVQDVLDEDGVRTSLSDPNSLIIGHEMEMTGH